MNWRAFRTLVRREVRRGQRRALLYAAVAGVMVALTAALPAEPALVLATLAIFAGCAVILSPFGDLRSDKTLGHLEFDRVLPMSHRTIAGARLLGAGVRTLPIALFALPMIIATDRGRELGSISWILAIAIPVVAWLLLTAVLWALMAVNVRWNLRRLWWLPMTIVFGPRLVVSMVPPSAKAALAGAAKPVLVAIGGFATSTGGVVVISLLLLAVPIGFLFGAISLFAAGLDRYSYDAAAGSLHTPAPKRELGAIGRGPLLAVSRYCIRLATEQSRRRLILLGLFVVALIIGSAAIKDYARFYVRALAALIPGGIAMQLGLARTRGYLEGMRQLPHPPVTLATGHLLAVAVLALPGSAVWVLARAVTGTPPTVGNVLSLYAWLTGWSWLASVATVWLTARRALLIAAVPAIGLGAWLAYAGLERLASGAREAFTQFGAFRANAGAIFPLLVSCTLMVAGVPLFARGLDEYEFHGAAKVSRRT